MKGNNRTQWFCKSCGVKVTTYVTLKYAPTHRCPRKAERVISLQPKEESNHE